MWHIVNVVDFYPYPFHISLPRVRMLPWKSGSSMY